MYLREFSINRQAFISACLGMGLGSALSHYTASLFGPELLAEFGWSKADFALLGSFALANLLFVPFAGRFVDRFGTPKRDAIRVVERYTISADRRRLDVLIDVEDPKTFTTSWSATIAYTLLPPKSAESPQDEVFAAIVCPENNRDAGGGGYPIPMATHFDF